MKDTDRFSKTILFCEDIDHAGRMRLALANENADLVAKNPKYVMKITGDDQEGKAELDNFIDPEQAYPVIACTSRLMSTGVDAKTCKLVVLDRSINSMTEFKQIIGRGTRIGEEYGKLFFTRRSGTFQRHLRDDPARPSERGQRGRVLHAARVQVKTAKDQKVLHTIVRLPNGVFAPYTGIKTNLLFFTKGGPTEHVWYFEHPYPSGYKSYPKTKPITIAEFDREKAWWGKAEEGFASRVESEYAWKASVEAIKEGSFNLDLKNPNRPEEERGDPDELLALYKVLAGEVKAAREELKDILAAALGGKEKRG